MHRPNLKKMQADCDAFNKENAVGARVMVRLDNRADLFETVTRSKAQILSGHSVVIWLEGVTGCYLLDRVKPVPSLTLTSKAVSMLVLTDLKYLDPIRVIAEDLPPDAGRILITCNDRSWVGSWGSLSGRTVRDFFMRGHPGDLLRNLACALKRTKADDAYLMQVIEAVQAGLRRQAALENSPALTEHQSCTQPLSAPQASV